MKNALNGVLIMELFISLGGVGGLMVQYSNELRVDRVFALVLGLTVFSISIGSAWAWIERQLNRWRPKSVGPTTTV
jgi:NitT/TauT family transport system permease protein